MTLPQFAYWFVNDAVSPEGDRHGVRPLRDSAVAPSARVSEPPSEAEIIESALVVRIGNGDQRALRTLYERIYAPLWDFARTVSDSRDAADDLVQEAFTLLWERAPAWDAQVHVRGFLYTTVRLRARNVARRRGVAARSAEAYQHDVARAVMSVIPATPIEHLEHRELIETLARVVAALPEPRRTALLLRWRDNLPYDEIARILEVSTTAAQHLVVRARAMVRREIEPKPPRK
jgi:RNA polymerase sigma-70 factor (ECF subfamily)